MIKDLEHLHRLTLFFIFHSPREIKFKVFSTVFLLLDDIIEANKKQKNLLHIHGN